MIVSDPLQLACVCCNAFMWVLSCSFQLVKAFTMHWVAARFEYFLGSEIR